MLNSWGKELRVEIEELWFELSDDEIKPGGYTWAKEARRFVGESLFGVDIDGTAVEIARLRLWLAIAVADNEPRPLPDLAYNLREGDSVRIDAFAKELQEATDSAKGYELEIDDLAKARNTVRDGLEKHRKIDSFDAKATRVSSDNLR